MLINTTQSFVYSLTLNDMVLYVAPSQTNLNYTHAFEIATFAVDLQKKSPQLIELSLSRHYCC